MTFIVYAFLFLVAAISLILVFIIIYVRIYHFLTLQRLDSRND